MDSVKLIYRQRVAAIVLEGKRLCLPRVDFPDLRPAEAA